MERLPRKLKKKVRACYLCVTNNPDTRKEKISRKSWINLKNDFSYWLKTCFSMENRRDANSVHWKSYSKITRKRLQNKRKWKQ